MSLQVGVFGFAVEVGALGGVGFEVVELAFGGVHDVLDELVLLGADAAMGSDLLGVGPFVVLVVPLLAEVGLRSGCEGEDTHALHAGGSGNASEIEEGGSDVDVEDHLVADGAGFDALGVAEHERDAQGGLVHEALVEETPFAEEVAVIGAVEDGGVVEDALLFEMIEDAADVVVDGDETGVEAQAT